MTSRMGTYGLGFDTEEREPETNSGSRLSPLYDATRTLKLR